MAKYMRKKRAETLAKAVSLSLLTRSTGLRRESTSDACMPKLPRPSRVRVVRMPWPSRDGVRMSALDLETHSKVGRVCGVADGVTQIYPSSLRSLRRLSRIARVSEAEGEMTSTFVTP